MITYKYKLILLIPYSKYYRMINSYFIMAQNKLNNHYDSFHII